jgi:hypothetical protein
MGMAYLITIYSNQIIIPQLIAYGKTSDLRLGVLSGGEKTMIKRVKRT